MPVHNGEEYLTEALDSLLAQTFTDFELIVSDNRSDDATGDICREYAARDARIRYLRSSVNRGAAWNHNKVIQAARGELFKLACHDDVCAPAMIERCVKALDENPDATIAWPRSMMMMRADMRTLQEYTSDMTLSSPLAAVRFGDLIDEAPPSFPLFGIIRMEALTKTPLFEPYKASDRVLLARLALLGPIVQVPEVLFYYRWHDHNASRLMSDPAAFLRWWDPAKGGGRAYPETRLLYEYVRSLWLLRLSLKERRECAREIRLWFQARNPLIKWELSRLLPWSRPAEPPPSGYLDRMMRRARRQRIKKTLYR